jgi:hypothetical protein
VGDGINGAIHVFRLTTVTEDGGVVLRLEGRLVGAWVDELARATHGAMDEGTGLTLDLAGVSFADARGIAALRDAAGRGVRITGGSTFVTELMRQDHA